VTRPRRWVGVVVLDGCRDGSAEVVARALGARAVPGPGLGLGPARAAGAAALLRRHRHRADGAGWRATTDADSRVPADWLVRQVSLAEAGADVVLGTVVVDDWGELPESAQRRWRATYVARDGHGHVHGANAGLRLDTYPPSAASRTWTATRTWRWPRPPRTAGWCAAGASRSSPAPGCAAGRRRLRGAPRPAGLTTVGGREPVSAPAARARGRRGRR